MRLLLAGLLLASATSEAIAEDDAKRGERVFQRCYACHSVVPGEVEGLQGPNLRGIVGRPIAAQEGFPYSDAMRRFAAAEGVWTPGLLERFVADPEALVPGTAMSAAPLAVAERADLLAYLKAND